MYRQNYASRKLAQILSKHNNNQK